MAEWEAELLQAGASGTTASDAAADAASAESVAPETVARGGTILFVGTKKQAQGSIAEQAQRVGQPFVNQRWLGGLLTNFQTVSKRLARMKELEEIDFDDTTKGFTKKELLIKKRELDKLHKSLGGIRNLTKTPSALWVVDTKKEHLAIDEARKLGIPIIGILDTNCDPDEVQYPIPGNDDAIRSVALLTRIVADAAAEGLIQRHQKPEGDGEAAEPMAEWEAELLQAGTPAPDADAAAPVEVPVESAPSPVESATSPVEPVETPAVAEEAPAEKKAASKPAAKAADKTAEKTAEKPAAKAPAAKKPAAKADAAKADAPGATAKPATKKPAAKADSADASK
ncbi:MAG TPA: 30S ribosomal protein S2 [Terrimesophilobacter sp.]|nr:30S ribosomal protein S2 [Terrimesophilobacter sp.]